MRGLISIFIFIALFFSSQLAKSQSVVESIQRLDTLTLMTLPSDVTLLFDNITKMTILFDDQTIPSVELPVTTRVRVYHRESERSIEYFVYETFPDGRAFVSDYIIVQRNLPLPLTLRNGSVIPFYVGWSRMCPDQLNAVGFTDTTFIIRRYSGAIFMQSDSSIRSRISGGEKI